MTDLLNLSYQELSGLTHRVVKAYYAVIDGDEIEGVKIKYPIALLGLMKAKLGPLVEGQEVNITIQGDRVTFAYHKTFLCADQDPNEDTDDYYKNLTEKYVVVLSPPKLTSLV